MSSEWTTSNGDPPRRPLRVLRWLESTFGSRPPPADPSVHDQFDIAQARELSFAGSPTQQRNESHNFTSSIVDSKWSSSARSWQKSPPILATTTVASRSICSTQFTMRIVINWLFFREDPQLRRLLFRVLLQEDVALEPQPVAREAEHRAPFARGATTMKRHREEEQAEEDSAFLEAQSTLGSVTSDRMELRCLTNAPELVKQVRKLNLGVLPVQCPEFCYRRAARDDNQLSWAATTAQSDGNDASNKSSRGTKVTGAIIAEYEAPNRAVHIRTLTVDPAYRRQGVGRQLIDKVVQQTRALLEDAVRVESVRLHVHVGNDDGIAFYEQMGFTQEARLEDYYRHLEPRACLVLSYALPQSQEQEDHGDKVKKD